MSEFPQTDLYSRVHGIGLPPEVMARSVVVVGSAVIENMVGPEVRRANDIDLIVDEGLFRHLRGQPGLEETTFPEGRPRLCGNGFDIGMSWNNKPMQELQSSGYERGGLRFVHLSEVYYAYKQGRGEQKDEDDLQIIRDRLYGPRPLPLAMLNEELKFVQGSLPERLRDPGIPSVYVAANGLHIVRVVFGNERESVRTYSGSVEPGPVPATFHAFWHTANGGRSGQRNIDAVNTRERLAGRPPLYTDRDRLKALGYFNHDAKLGDGRDEIIGPDGQLVKNPDHDEKQSAELAAQHLEAAGETDEDMIEGTYENIIATTFKERTKAQNIDRRRGQVKAQHSGAHSDLSSFRSERALVDAMGLIPEDFCRIAVYDRPLLRLLEHINSNLSDGAEPVRIETPEDGLQLIADHSDFLVTKFGDPPITMTILEAAVDHLETSSDFCAKYTYDERYWALGSPVAQALNSRRMATAAARIRAGESIVQVYREEFGIMKRAMEDGHAGTPGSATEMSGAAVGTIGAVREAIQYCQELLPHAAGEQAIQIVEQAMHLMGAVAEGSAAGDLQEAHTHLTQARELLGKLQTALHIAADKLQQYDSNIGGAV